MDWWVEIVVAGLAAVAGVGGLLLRLSEQTVCARCSVWARGREAFDDPFRALAQ